MAAIRSLYPRWARVYLPSHPQSPERKPLAAAIAKPLFPVREHPNPSSIDSPRKILGHLGDTKITPMPFATRKQPELGGPTGVVYPGLSALPRLN